MVSRWRSWRAAVNAGIRGLVSIRVAGLATGVAVVWGLCFVLIQSALPSPAPLLLAGLRALIGGGVLGAWVVLSRRLVRTPRSSAGPAGPKPGRKGFPSARVVILLAVANATVALGAMYLAAGRAEGAVASILAGGQPLVLVAAGWAIFGERASARAVAGLAIAMAGVILVATTSSGATSPDGVALALLAAAAPVVGTVLMRRVGPNVDLVVTTSVQFLLGGAMLVAASALLESWAALSWSWATIAGLLVLGVLGTGVAYVLWFWLLGRTSMVHLGAALTLVPVVGVVSGIVVGDRPPAAELAGIVVMLVGIGIVSVGSAVTGRPPPDRRPDPRPAHVRTAPCLPCSSSPSRSGRTTSLRVHSCLAQPWVEGCA